MESDERFKHLASDPRFKTLRKKQRKVQIDDRFKSMFTDEKFTLQYKQDKRGRNQKKSAGDDLKRYYHLEDKEDDEAEAEKASDEDEKECKKAEVADEDDDDDDEEVGEGSEDESAVDEGEEEDEDEDEEDDDGIFRKSDGDDDESTTSDVSSSSDESESEGPESDADDLVEKIQYDWQPLDHDAERAEVITKRIAIQNLDWNHLDVRDIYTLVNSIRPPLNVRVYVSEFGKERLAKEEVEGPQELAEMPQLDEEEEEYQQLEEKMQALQNNDKKYKANEYEDADEIVDSKNEEIRERLRRYQLSQMKYYYAIVEFDSPESAQAVYKELDGIEYEGSSLELDLRYVPDEMEFDAADIKAECDKVPDLATYKAPQFINSALQQTTVKFTWDETDVKRQEKLHKAYTKSELEKDDLEAYLGSETDSEDEGEDDDDDGEKSETMTTMTGNSEARANKYRQLLASLDEEAERKKKADIDVEWDESDPSDSEANGRVAGPSDDDDDEEDDGLYEDGDRGIVEDEEDDEDDEDEDEDPRGGARRTATLSKKQKREQVKAMKKLLKRTTKKQTTKKSAKRKADGLETAPAADPDLDLLVMDARGTGNKKDDFKFDPDDDRFRAVYDSGLYNIDPSHPKFKKTEAFEQIAERKRDKRRRRN